MSRNISKLSGRKGLKDNLFKRMISTTKKSDNEKQIKQLAEEYHVGMSTIHGAESFYEFLRPEHKEKKAWVCNGSACMCAGNQDNLKEKLVSKLGKDKVGEMFCLGHCYDNTSFHYNGHNYSGKDIDQIDKIIKGEDTDLDVKIFTLGHRNPQGFTKINDSFFSVEHGPKGGDELNKIIKDKNYGWPTVSYGTQYVYDEDGKLMK